MAFRKVRWFHGWVGLSFPEISKESVILFREFSFPEEALGFLFLIPRPPNSILLCVEVTLLSG